MNAKIVVLFYKIINAKHAPKERILQCVFYLIKELYIYETIYMNSR